MNHCWNVRIFSVSKSFFFGKFILLFLENRTPCFATEILETEFLKTLESFEIPSFIENLWIKSLRPLPRHHQCCGGFVRPYPRFTQLFRNFTGYLWKSQSVVRPETLYEENYETCIFNAGLSLSWALLWWK